MLLTKIVLGAGLAYLLFRAFSLAFDAGYHVALSDIQSEANMPVRWRQAVALHEDKPRWGYRCLMLSELMVILVVIVIFVLLWSMPL